MAQSYFNEEACAASPHFCLTGWNTDSFVSDTGAKTGIEHLLTKELKESGFDAVVFFDAVNRPHCYDQDSYYVLRYATVPQHRAEPAAAPAGHTISAAGPMGRRRSQPAKEERPAMQTDMESNRWNMGRMTLPAAWDQINHMLSDGKARVAVVFSNMHSLQFSFPEASLQILQQLPSNPKHSIAVYMFRDSMYENMAADGCPQWNTFYKSILQPCMHAASGSCGDHVILIGAPNAAEIRNLLLYMRREKLVYVRPFEIKSIAERFAAACAEDKCRLEMLYLRIRRYFEEHPEEMLSMENADRVFGRPNRKTAEERIQDMIGLEQIKKDIGSWSAMMAKRNAGKTRMSQQNSSRIARPPQAVVTGHVLNQALIGNPGTGKSVVAKLHGQICYELGLLPKGHTIEVNGGTLVSDHVGGTARNVHEQIMLAMGGVLFIDEAYALMTSDFGEEAIDQLTADTSKYAGQLAVVIAGYPKQMDALLYGTDTNVGFARRFPTVYRLEDYTPEQLQRIFMQMMEKDMDHISVSDELKPKLENFFENFYAGRGKSWGNAGEAENLLADMKRQCARRQPNAGQFVLTSDDIPERLKGCLLPRLHSIKEALRQIDTMIGLKNVKTFLRQRYLDIMWDAIDRTPGNYIFSGPPGAGKTHVARMLAGILHLLGILRRNVVVECRPDELMRSADPMKQLSEAVEDARGGLLFLDEAHQLCGSDIGIALIHAIVPIVEHPEIHEDTAVVLAGYHAEMKEFLQVDGGLPRRFPMRNRIRFCDYSATELTQILQEFCTQRGENASADYLARSRAALERYLENRPMNFGNGGFIRDTWLPESIAARTERLNRMYGEKDGTIQRSDVEAISDEEKHTLTAEDLPKQWKKLAGPLSAPVPPERTALNRLQELLSGQAEIAEYMSALQIEDEDCFMDEPAALSMHFSIAGDYGSGRRTAAGAIAAVLHQLNLLESDQVTVVSKGDMEAGFVGQTADKTRAVIERAAGGMLVVMNPSDLMPRSANDNSFCGDILQQLAAALGRMDISLVFIDSVDGMQRFFRYAPKFRSRMTRSFVLPKLTAEELYELFDRKTGNSMHFTMDMKAFFDNWHAACSGLPEWGGGNEVEMLASEIRMNWKRLEGERMIRSGITYRVIVPEMLPKHLQKYAE